MIQRAEGMNNFSIRGSRFRFSIAGCVDARRNEARLLRHLGESPATRRPSASIETERDLGHFQTILPA